MLERLKELFDRRQTSVSDVARREERQAEWERLTAEGFEAMGRGDQAKSVEKFTLAAVILGGLASQINLIRAFAAAKKYEMARFLLASLRKNHEDDESKQADLNKLSAAIALPPEGPTRERFRLKQEIRGNLTGMRWVVIEAGKAHGLEGGMGVVYKVRDQEDGQICAVKTYRPECLWSEIDRKRFLREAGVCMALAPHPNLVETLWIDSIEGFPCVVQEFVEGGSLFKLLENEKLTLRRAIPLAVQFCDGMSFVHDKYGLIHRDIKPDNCLLTAGGSLKICDFGLARAFEEGVLATFGLADLHSFVKSNVTTIYGTPFYRAPEQADPEATLDFRTDIHAFGAMLYEMLSHDRGGCETKSPTLDYIAYALNHSDIPKSLKALILRCVDPDPARRPQSFSEIRAEIVEFDENQHGRRIPAQQFFEPADSAYWSNRAISLRLVGRLEEALKHADRAIKIEATDPDLWQNRAAVLIDLKRFEEAEHDLKHALGLSPKDGDILNNLGYIHLARQDYLEAADHFRQALELSPSDPVICKNLGEALCQSGKADEGLQAAQRGLEYDQRDGALLEFCGFACVALRRGSEAESYFDRGIAISPLREGLWRGKALLAREAGDYALALTHIAKGLESKPDDEECHKVKIELLHDNNDQLLAIEAADTAVRALPGNEQLRRLRDRLHLELKSSPHVDTQ